MFRVTFLLNIGMVVIVLAMSKTPTLILAADTTEDVKGTSSGDLKVDDFLAKLNQIDVDLAALSEGQEDVANDTDQADDISAGENSQQGIKLTKKELREFPLNGSQEVLVEETEELPFDDIVIRRTTERKAIKPENASTGEKKVEDKASKENETVARIVKPDTIETKKKESAVKSEQKIEETPAKIDENEVIEEVSHLVAPFIMREEKTEVVDPKDELEIISEIVPSMERVGKDKFTVAEEVEVEIEIGLKTYREIVIEKKEDKLPKERTCKAEDEKAPVTESNMITVAKDQVFENPKEKDSHGLGELNDTEFIEQEAEE